MRYVALELNDRALSIARKGRVLTSSPSAVFDGTGSEPAGTNAWQVLRSRPRAVATRHLSTVLTRGARSAGAVALLQAELQARLAEQPFSPAEPIWIVTPAGAEADGAAVLLDITRGLGVSIAGFVDSAVVTSAALSIDRSAIVLEIGLHHVAATAVDCDGRQARRRRTVSTGHGGLIELYQVWLDLASTSMVKRTRFDPLHDAATEQQFFDTLPALALEVAREGSATATVSRGAERFEAVLTKDQFARAADSMHRSVLDLLHQLRPAGSPVTIVIPRMAARLPGLRELLEQFAGCQLMSVPDGFAAAATSSLDLPEPDDDRPFRWLRRLPLPAQAALPDDVTCEALGQSRSHGSAPSHVLWDGRAYALNADSLVVGRGLADSSHGLSLPEGFAGVSRRHCTFVHDGNELVLHDHSTFGTFVNGERVQERVMIRVGDRVRLGEPGAELAFIAVGEVAAATPHA